MAYDDQLAERVREVLSSRGEFTEIRMFGGLCFTVNTHMAVGIIRDELMVRVGADGVEGALSRGATEMRMGERTMTGMVSVASADLPDESALRSWVDPAVDAALARPPKKPKSTKSTKSS